MTVTTDADARFDRTVERWFRDQLATYPEFATFLGIHDYDAELRVGSHEQIDREIERLRSIVAEMEPFGGDQLSPDRALDRDLLVHESRLELFRLTELRPWARSTDAAAHIGDALVPLFTRDFAPLEERLASMAGRLEAAPRYLRETRERLSDPVRLWVQIDLQSTAALPGFLDTIIAAARTESRDQALAARLEQAVAAAKAALDEHAAWLREKALPDAHDEWAAGADRFETLVQLRELEASGDEILAVGEQMLAESKAARDAVCAEIDPSLSPAEVADLVKDDHPATFAEALEDYRSGMDKARRFIAEHDLATLPEEDHLVVIETPSFVRHLIPFAAYYEPAKFDRVPLGVYVVTPPSTPEMMREHSYAGISNTGVHEAYPGHHLQLSAAVTNPSLVRLFSFAPEFAEGWAFYCERMMKEQGFDDTPANWYIVHTDAIWRATRIILDVKLHRGQIGFDEAVDYLVAQTGFERPAALAEVKRYTSTPTYQLSYLYGRHMIERLKGEVQARMGPAFNLKFFHDTLLYGGTMPVSYARRLFETRFAPDR